MAFYQLVRNTCSKRTGDGDGDDDDDDGDGDEEVVQLYYSQSKSSVPPKILLMSWLFEKWIH